ncbi:Protein arginine N-methyltransferase 2 [Vulpes lagopus]
MASLAIKEFFSKPKYNHILKPEDCLSEPCTILQLDTRTVQIADLETTSGELHFEIRKAGALHGFTAWFSVRFQSPQEDEPQLVLSTGPFHLGGREGLSHLETTVEVVGSRCCRIEPGRRRAWM